ncbi:MAG: hypothetical protein CVU96_03245 [Firmicutes bacterium HGW-Firmicutes-20]|nr:MAG: hypothetical protein CVU96_03245 [Firmicutes bacterium HGW-Firmicutes-20]
MKINDGIIKHYLKNVFFINGTAYAGKSTMAALLASKHNMILCGENYHTKTTSILAYPEQYPNLCYFHTMKDWQEFVNRTPEEYSAWIEGTTNELVEFEIAELIHISKDRKVIVDTNIPIEILKRIADHHQVAILLSPQSMSVDRFFDRKDPDKQFLLSQIQKAENPEKTMENFRKCIAKINSKENYDMFLNSGFFTIIREQDDVDTRLETLAKLEEHFGLIR